MSVDHSNVELWFAGEYTSTAVVWLRKAVEGTRLWMHTNVGWIPLGSCGDGVEDQRKCTKEDAINISRGYKLDKYHPDTGEIIAEFGSY
jgi:hypothetical protein